MPERSYDEPYLTALGCLGASSYAHPEELFDQGLGLLVQQLGVDRAMVASLTDRGLENLWCAGAPGGTGTLRPQDPNQNFCLQVIRHPEDTLVIPDAGADPLWVKHPGWRKLGVRAYVGASLRYSDRPAGVLSVQSEAAHSWQPAEVALVQTMAALFAKTMEVETLKARLGQAQDALDLSAAVVEDSALESCHSGLPNRRYLEVWCKSNLTHARRRGELIALAAWTHPPVPGRNAFLRTFASALRGVDLLVDLGRDWFLLVLPRTLPAGAEVVLERLRRQAGALPVGATLWNPLLNPDRDSPTLQPAIRRAQGALAPGLEPGAEGAHDGTVVWTFLEPSRQNLLNEPGPW